MNALDTRSALLAFAAPVLALAACASRPPSTEAGTADAPPATSAPGVAAAPPASAPEGTAASPAAAPPPTASAVASAAPSASVPPPIEPLEKPLPKKPLAGKIGGKPFKAKGGVVLRGNDPGERFLEIYPEAVSCKDAPNGVVEGDHPVSVFISVPWKEGLSGLAARVTTVTRAPDGNPVSGSYQDPKPIELVTLGDAKHPAKIRVSIGQADWDDFIEGEVSLDVCETK